MFSSLLYYHKNYATQLAPSVGKKERTEPAELIRWDNASRKPRRKKDRGARRRVSHHGLEHGSTCSWRELSKAFTIHFITNTRKPKEVDLLMALTIKSSESLKSYSVRYWETYNKIVLCEEDLAFRQFRFGLPTGCRIRQSLTKKPPLNMTDLMFKIEQHICVEEDGVQILHQIKDKPYFVLPPKMGGDPASRESKPYCACYKKKGHLIENCRAYKGFLEELVRNGHLRQFVDDTKQRQQQDHPPKPKDPIRIIEVIHTHTRAANLRAETLTATHLQEVFQVYEDASSASKRLRKEITEEITFTNHDLKGVKLPHSDALVVTMREREENDGRLPQKKYAEELEKYQIPASDQEKYFLLGTSLPPEQKDGLLALLLEYIDVFAWNPYEAPDVDPAFTCHNLNMDPLSLPVIQKGRRTAPFHKEAVCKEVNRLIEVGAIREILYPTWLSNTVVVKKKNRKWRDELPRRFPRIPPDSYESGRPGKNGVHYTKGDLLLSKDHLKDLQAVFNILRLCRLKLNVSKCAFGVGSGKFLGFMVTQRGIEANPNQITAILNLKPPKTIWDIQRLTEMAVALNCFISRSAEKCCPFFNLIKKDKNFQWANQSDQAFEQLKAYLTTASLLATPMNEDLLYIYLAASKHAVSAVIVREEHGIQKLVYYTSKTLNGAESRYLPLEKLAFSLICTIKKLPHYFQAHTMIVLTEHPLKALLRSVDFLGQITKWGAQLGAYDIKYQPRTSIKGQVLTDFIAEFTPTDAEPLVMNQVLPIQQTKKWKLYIDRASNSRSSSLSIVLTTPQAKDEKMATYLTEAKRLLKEFNHVQVMHIGRDLNGHADALVSLASAVAPELRKIISMICSLRNEKKRIRSEELHHGIGYQKKGISTVGPTPGPTSVVFTLIPSKTCCERFTKECIEGPPEDDLWLTGP
uniref:Reverse transcriptase/retrotransposon-derived protein RNase H-like domain-containing protein n=1 Tax=Fagus sylvatica TaxID=28930 RepID=A0A2N9J0X2_FAGSY